MAAPRPFTILGSMRSLPALLAAASFLASPVAVAAQPARAGSYHCVFFINGSLQTVPGFTLSGARYTHQNGGGGSVRYKGNVIEFVGGPLTGQAGKVEPGIVRIYNEKRSRTVIDCDNKR